MKLPKCAQKRERGFALIATIVVMSLLMLLSIAMLQMSSVSTKTTQVSSHQQIAEDNARMAAMIALGQLQEKLGSDQRSSATAAIVSDSVDRYKKNWTTAWDTSAWDPTDPLTTRDDYYLGALVSGADYSEPSTRSSAATALESSVPAGDPDWVTLVNEGTVVDDDDYVFVPKVSIRDHRDAITGKYAYWIGDEGVKARVDVRSSSEDPLNDWAKAGKLASNPGTGIHKIAEMENYSDYLPEAGSEADLEKILTYQTLNRSNITSDGPGASATKDVFKANYHSLTTSHVGLLTDSRKGGIRKDLSVAFEVEPEVFSEIDEFNNSGETNTTAEYSTFGTPDVTTNPLYYSSGTDPELGYLYEIPVDSSRRFRGPTWDILRNHYRLYKKERNSLGFRGLPAPSNDALVAHGVVPFSYNGATNSFIGSSPGAVTAGPNISGANNNGQINQAAFVMPHGKSGGVDPANGDRVQPTVQKIAPELIRIATVYGIAREQNNFYFTASPFITLHNPYNYPIEFHSVGVDVRGIGPQLRFDVNYTKSSGSSASERIYYQHVVGQALSGITSYRLEPLNNGLHRLEPGEIKMMSTQPNLAKASNNSGVIRLTEFGYNVANGTVSSHLNTLDVKPNTQMTLTVTADRFTATLGGMFVRLYHPDKATGGSYNMTDPGNFSNGNNYTHRYHDTEPLSLIKNIKIYPTQSVISRKFMDNEVRDPSLGYLALAVTDYRMKTFQDDVAVISDFNYRSLGVDTRDLDAEDIIAPNWDFELSALGSYEDLKLTDNLGGGAYWGDSHTTSGQSNIVLFDLPRGPSVSLASLQHADTSILNFHPMHSIAHSRAQVGQSDLTTIYDHSASASRGGSETKFQLDTSWASNDALWDRYYYSGLNWGSTAGQPYETQTKAIQAIIDGDGHKVFANSRMELLSPITSNDLSELTSEEAYAEIGKHLGITGAFNVNSTNVDAWKAVLAGLSGHEISYLSGSTMKEETLDTSLAPMTRFSTPAGDETDDYMGFRALDDDELDKLAEAIVEQVKLRGPFMGLADFVNRRLLKDETGESGAIQAAIDEAAMNASIAGVATSDSGLEHSAPQSNQGLARHLTQGDVLTVLAPVMTTRSDTFIIRSYGESVDQSGVVKATAWCEFVVQRSTDWVENTTESATIPNPDYPSQTSMEQPILQMQIPNPSLPENCQNYGRKFIVKSFRYLSRDEI